MTFGMTGGSLAATAIWGLLAVLLVLDGFRMRARASALVVLAPSDEPVSPGHHFITRPGKTLDDAIRRAASAHARAHGLDVLDLIPPALHVGRALFLLQAIDVRRFRSDRIAKGVSAGEAILVQRDVLARMKGPSAPTSTPTATPTPAPADAVAFCELAQKLKLYAGTTMDFAVAPGLPASPNPVGEGRALIRLLFSDFAVPVIYLQLGLLAAGPFVTRIAGVAALVALCLQALVVTLGTTLRPRGLLLYTLFRPFFDLATVLGIGAKPLPDDRAMGLSLRPVYEGLLARGLDRYFEPRRATCPLCASTKLEVRLRATDLIQRKPGHFILERCAACGLVFQNPRLSIDGLGFYYRDFYDGLGEAGLEAIFGAGPGPYLVRARMLKGHIEPKRWVDVGTGHGHFCLVGREVWPETTFDGIDFSESIEEAERRGWVARGYRALFPDIAPEIAAKGELYDVVSMSHYLEHTRDPRSEIEAAAKVLRQGGILLVEVPDPESIWGSLLGRLWLPWFQPQHQHFLTARHLDEAFRASGFETLLWHRGEAHQPVDFFLALVLLLHVIAPPPDRPWRKPTTSLGRLWGQIVWWSALPLLLASHLMDRLIAPLNRRPGWSNTMRVLARRTG